MKDSLGNRIKGFYENRARIYLPRRGYTIIRIDGKAFHTYTKELKKPFDDGLINDMNETALFLCQNIQGAKFAYIQSDEISILLTDFDTITTDAWFDGNIQKITSVSASMTTAKFNALRFIRYITENFNQDVTNITPLWIKNLSKIKEAMFDSRVFTIPSNIEVANYFIWRQQDAVRNSISSVAQTLYSHKELEKCSTNRMQEMIFQKGINWDSYPASYKRGRLILKEIIYNEDNLTISRTKWKIYEPPIFTKDNGFLRLIIPVYS